MLSKIVDVLVPVLNEKDVELKDIEYLEEGNIWYLRIYVDTAQGIDLNKIVEISPIISDLLDEYDFIENEYILEVSSPGAEKRLRTKEDFEEVVGENIFVEFNEPVSNYIEVGGRLISFKNNELLVEHNVKGVNKKITFTFENVKFARLAVKF